MTLRLATDVMPTISSTSATRDGADAVARGDPAQVVAAAAARMDVSGVEQRTDLEQRLVQLAVALAVERGGASLEPVETEHAAHRGALARPVRPEEAGDPAGVHVEAQVVDRDLLAEAFGDVSDLDHVMSERLASEQAGKRPVAGPVSLDEARPPEVPGYLLDVS